MTAVALHFPPVYGKEGTFERETRALLKLRSRLSCRHNIIVTYDDEGIIEKQRCADVKSQQGDYTVVDKIVFRIGYLILKTVRDIGDRQYKIRFRSVIIS